ncbi:MAG: hypothetical protein ACK518_00150 [bacterium]|jgi:hypothetical protein
MNKTKFLTEVQAYQAPNDLDVDSFCIDILFNNQATGTVYINGFPVIAGGTLSINGNLNEINVTKYKISFAGATGTVYVQRRKYI